MPHEFDGRMQRIEAEVYSARIASDRTTYAVRAVASFLLISAAAGALGVTIAGFGVVILTTARDSGQQPIGITLVATGGIMLVVGQISALLNGLRELRLSHPGSPMANRAAMTSNFNSSGAGEDGQALLSQYRSWLSQRGLPDTESNFDRFFDEVGELAK